MNSPKYFFSRSIAALLFILSISANATTELSALDRFRSSCPHQILLDIQPDNSWENQSDEQRLETLKEVFSFHSSFNLEKLIFLTSSDSTKPFSSWLMDRYPQYSEEFTTENIKSILAYGNIKPLGMAGLFHFPIEKPFFTTSRNHALRLSKIVVLRHLAELFLISQASENFYGLAGVLFQQIPTYCDTKAKKAKHSNLMARAIGRKAFNKICAFFDHKDSYRLEESKFTLRTRERLDPPPFTVLEILIREIALGLPASEKYYLLPLEEAEEAYSKKSPDFAKLIEMSKKGLQPSLEIDSKPLAFVTEDIDLESIEKLLFQEPNAITLAQLQNEQLRISAKIRDLSMEFSAAFKSTKIDLDAMSRLLQADSSHRPKNLEALISQTQNLPATIDGYFKLVEKLEKIHNDISNYVSSAIKPTEGSDLVSASQIIHQIDEINKKSHTTLTQFKTLLVQFFESYNKVNYLFNNRLLEDANDSQK